MTTDPHKSAIEALGWEPVEACETYRGSAIRTFQARFRGFRTPWRASWGNVLSDVREVGKPQKQEMK